MIAINIFYKKNNYFENYMLKFIKLNYKNSQHYQEV